MRYATFLGLTLLFLIGITAAQSTKAQDLDADDLKITQRELATWQQSEQRYEQSYDTALREVKEGKLNLQNRVRAMRVYYSWTSQYTPFSEKIIDELTRYAYKADTETEPREINKALAQYRNLLDKHIVNLDVLDFAITLSLADVRYGDSIFLKNVRAAIINSLTEIINVGKTPESPYRIITYGEETYILGTFNGGRIEKSEIYNVDRTFYNVHDISMPNGQYLQIYMDVTAPIRNVKIKQIVSEKKERINISGQ